MNEKIYNKKSSIVLATFISIGLTVVTFIYIISSISSQNDIITNNLDVEKCNIKLKGGSGFFGDSLISEIPKKALNSFLYGVNLDCKKEEIKSGVDKEVFNQLSDMMVRTWAMYGAGEVDFLSKFESEGNYCFVGGVLLPNEKEGKEYSYTEFEKYLDIKKVNGKKFNDVVSISYSGGESVKKRVEDLVSLENDLQELLGEGNFEDFTKSAYSDYLKSISNLDKKIDTSEKTFVILKFERVKEDFSKDVIDFLIGFAIAEAASTVVVAGATYGLLAIPKAGLSILKTGTAIFKIGKITTIFQKFSKLKRISRVKKLQKIDIKKLRFTEANVKELDKILPGGFKDKGGNLLFGGAAKSRFGRILKEVDSNGVPLISKIKTPLLVSILPAGTYGSYSALYNKNYIQYVEVLDQQSYYRECGFEPQFKNA